MSTPNAAGFDSEFISQNETPFLRTPTPKFFRVAEPLVYALCCKGVDGFSIHWWDDGKSCQNASLTSFIKHLPNMVVCHFAQVDYEALLCACKRHRVEFPHHIVWLDSLAMAGAVEFSALMCAKQKVDIKTGAPNGRYVVSVSGVSLSLSSVAECLGIGAKEIEGKDIAYSGRHPESFSPQEKAKVLKYCLQDAYLSFAIGKKIAPLLQEGGVSGRKNLVNFWVADKINRRGTLVDQVLQNELLKIYDVVERKTMSVVSKMTTFHSDVETPSEPYVTRMSQKKALKTWANFQHLIRQYEPLRALWCMNSMSSIEDEIKVLDALYIDCSATPFGKSKGFEYVTLRKEYRSKMYLKDGKTLRSGVSPLHHLPHLELILEILSDRFRVSYPKVLFDSFDKKTLNNRTHMLPKSHRNYELGQEFLRWRNIAQQAAFTKAKACLDFMSCDGRIHFAYQPLLTQSGRFTSRGINLQNLKRDDVDTSITQKVLNQHIDTNNTDELREVAKIARRLFVAKKGHTYINFDFKSMEMLSTYNCFVNQEGMTDVILAGGDIYTHSAETYLSEALGNIEDAKQKRSIAKTLMLAAQYGMGAVKMKDHLFNATNIVFDDEVVKKLVSSWRRGNDKVVKYRRDLMLNMAKCYRTGAAEHEHYSMKYDYTNNIGLRLMLPSKRPVYYWGLKVETGNQGDQVSFLSTDPASRRVRRESLHQGSVYAHYNSGVCSDIFTDMVNHVQLTYPWMPIEMMTHDDVVVCVPDERVQEAKDIMLGLNTTPSYMPTAIGKPVVFPMNAKVLKGFVQQY